MDLSRKFCLKWNEFGNNTSSTFYDLWQDTNFSDVTLVGECNNKITAHKVILAASSPVFKNILNQNIHPRPIIYMRGIEAKFLVSIIDFIYHGQTEIFYKDLDEFLLIAEELELKGVAEGSNINREYEHIEKTLSIQQGLQEGKDKIISIDNKFYKSIETEA